MSAPETLPLTRRALAAWTHWSEADDREHAARCLALAPGEAAALARLDQNLRAAGPPEGWFANTRDLTGMRAPTLDGTALPRVLAGLTYAEEAVPALTRILQPRTLGVEALLARALEKGAEKAIPAPRPRQPVGSGLARLAAYIDREGLDLTRTFTFAERNALAAACEIGPTQIDVRLRELRRQRGIAMPPGVSRGTRARLVVRDANETHEEEEGMETTEITVAPEAEAPQSPEPPAPVIAAMTAVVTPTNGAEPPITKSERFREIVARDHIDLGRALPQNAAVEIAREIGSTPQAVQILRRKLAREAGQTIPAHGKLKEEFRALLGGDLRRERTKEELQEMAGRLGTTLNTLSGYLQRFRAEEAARQAMDAGTLRAEVQALRGDAREQQAELYAEVQSVRHDARAATEGLRETLEEQIARVHLALADRLQDLCQEVTALRREAREQEEHRHNESVAQCAAFNALKGEVLALMRALESYVPSEESVATALDRVLAVAAERHPALVAPVVVAPPPEGGVEVARILIEFGAGGIEPEELRAPLTALALTALRGGER